jgi:preprotein translocase subunit SecF
MVKVNRVRRIIRKIDPWTVLKVTFVLNFIVALTMVLGFSILWVLLVNAGVPQGLEDIARRLALLDADASLVGNVEPLFSSVVFLATVYLLTQTALATIGAFFYNLVSDLVGGIEVVVLEESYNNPQEKISENTRDENQDNKETVMMTFSKTLKNLKNEEDENE